MPLTTPRNHATLVYDMSRIKDWIWWRINHSFEEWKAECLRSKNRAIIQTHNGATLWARLEDYNQRHQSEYYSEISDMDDFYLTFKETCDFWADGRDSARNIRRNERAIAFAQISYMGVVWQIGRSEAYLEY